MKRNIELKAEYPDLDHARRIAEELGAVLHADMRQRDTYFASPTGRLKLRRIVPISTEGGKTDERAELIGYRRDDRTEPRASDYDRVPIDDAPGLARLLDQTLGVTIEVLKHRVVYLHDNVRIHLDDVQDLGRFIEFEAIVDEHCDDLAARAKVKRLREAFGIADERIAAGSYADLLHST
ncbi:MAG: class IV adenylate cyclase [Phycisphaerae bacterium]|nr:class IV adenylate cyclase [Phycisphaerae bacterium]